MSGTIFTSLDMIVPGNSSLLASELKGCFLADGSVSKRTFKTTVIQKYLGKMFMNLSVFLLLTF